MTFDDVLTIKNGKNQRAVENANGRYPIYGSGGIMGYADDYICNPDTVIIGRKGNINKPIFVEEPFWNVDTAFGLEADKSVLLPKYLFYFCLKYDFERHNKAVTIPSLTKADLLKIEIELPSLKTQEDIVNQLDAISRTITLREEQLSKCDDLIKARFVELFGDIVLNPIGHQETTVAEYCQMTQGTQIPMSEQISEYKEGYYRYLYIRDLKYEDDNWIYVLDQYDEKKLTEDDLVVVNTGNTAGEIYRGKDGILSNNLFKVSFDTEILSTTYLYYYFGSDAFQKMLWSEMKEGTQPHLGHKIFGSKKLLVPPMAIQEQFSNFVKQVDKSKVAVQKSLDETQLLFDSLIQEYFG